MSVQDGRDLYARIHKTADEALDPANGVDRGRLRYLAQRGDADARAKLAAHAKRDHHDDTD